MNEFTIKVYNTKHINEYELIAKKKYKRDDTSFLDIFDDIFPHGKKFKAFIKNKNIFVLKVLKQVLYVDSHKDIGNGVVDLEFPIENYEIPTTFKLGGKYYFTSIKLIVD